MKAEHFEGHSRAGERVGDTTLPTKFIDESLIHESRFMLTFSKISLQKVSAADL